MQLAELQRNWNEFGRTDPLWSVLTDARFKDNKWDPVAFFKTGEQEVESVLAGLTALGVTMPRRRALDFGCAVGRLTQALCRHFERCDGVDIAPSMIDLAREYDQFPSRCHYHLNEADDLALFPDNTFDFIYSRLVLQHMEPRYSKKYIAEFVRVLAPGGVAFFQIPAGPPAPGQEPPREWALPEAGFRASIEIDNMPATLEAGSPHDLQVRVTNSSPVAWPRGQHSSGRDVIVLGNHWLLADGKPFTPDDGRTALTDGLRPSETAYVPLRVIAPTAPGSYLLELDMVQEGVSWFAPKGSRTCRIKVDVCKGAGAQPVETAPVMEMYGVPQQDVLGVVEAAGGQIVAVLDDHSAEPLLSYQYVVTKTKAQQKPAPAPAGRVAAAPSGIPDGGNPEADEALLLLNGLAQHAALQARVSEALAKRLLGIERLVRETHELVNHVGAGVPTGGRFAVYQGNNLALTRILNRYSMYVDTTDVSIGPHLITHGQWEPWITSLFTRLLRPGMTAVDIGANFGYYTILAGFAVGATGRVYALEADPRNYEVLQLNLTVNGLLDIVQSRQCAVLDAKKRVELRRNPTLLGCHSLFAGEQGSARNVSVEALPLDEIIPGSVDFMKIDAEGSEPFIFDGMRNVLERSPQVKIIMEFNVPVLKLAGVDPASFLRKIHDHHFTVSIIPREGDLEPLNEQKLLDGPLYDLLLIRK
ncbi:MAG: class I SAM-dependent methyltransferase [Acidobacteriia bacterium]|nr:class I SAM-dependent methyltransferase [Terriglobia bacterium]